jgi:microcystin-dependent protein
MTQAFNLGQLANNLSTSGQLDATDGLVGAVPIANGGTGATTAANARTNLDVAQAVYAVPAGGIIIWSGSQASIPTGWLLCNGTSSTPDLRDRFIVGAGSTYAVAASGGSANAILVSHTHTFTGTALGTHQHTVSAENNNFPGSDMAGGSYGNYATATTSAVSAGTPAGTNSTEGSSGTNANLPPYYALCYIMKS